MTDGELSRLKVLRDLDRPGLMTEAAAQAVEHSRRHSQQLHGSTCSTVASLAMISAGQPPPSHR